MSGLIDGIVGGGGSTDGEALQDGSESQIGGIANTSSAVDQDELTQGIEAAVGSGFTKTVDENLPKIESSLQGSVVNSTEVAMANLEATSGRIIDRLSGSLENTSSTSIAFFGETAEGVVDYMDGRIQRTSALVMDDLASSLDNTSRAFLELLRAEVNVIVAATAADLSKVASDAIKEGTDSLPTAASAATESAIQVVRDSGVVSIVGLGVLFFVVNVMSLVVAFLVVRGAQSCLGSVSVGPEEQQSRQGRPRTPRYGSYEAIPMLTQYS